MEDFLFYVVLAFFVIFVFIIAATGLRIVRPWEKGLDRAPGEISGEPSTAGSR